MELEDLQRLHDDYRVKTRCLSRPARSQESSSQLMAINARLAALSREEFRAFLTRVNRNTRSVEHVLELFDRLKQISAQEDAHLAAGDLPGCAALLADDVVIFRHICREVRDHYTQGVGVQVIGYGEITSSLTLSDRIWLDASLRPQSFPSDWVFKSLPKFPNSEEARRYAKAFYRYADLLRRVGLKIPEQKLAVEKAAPRTGSPLRKHPSGVGVYIVQRRLNAARIGNALIQSVDRDAALALIRRVVLKMAPVFAADVMDEEGRVRLGLDGQVSNWCFADLASTSSVLYLDTSTPLLRVDGTEQINPEIFLKNTPGFMRAFIRRFFLQDVLDRYYDFRRVLVDLIANLRKEGWRELVAPAVALVNDLLTGDLRSFGVAPLTEKEIEAYYREDVFIWRFFQTARQLDRFVTEAILGKRYPFRLPGKIKR